MCGCGDERHCRDAGVSYFGPCATLAKRSSSSSRPMSIGLSTSDELSLASFMPTSLWQALNAPLHQSFLGEVRPARADARHFSVAADSVDKGEGTGSTGPTGSMGSTGSDAADVDGSNILRVGRVLGCLAGGIPHRDIVTGSCLQRV